MVMFLALSVSRVVSDVGCCEVLMLSSLLLGVVAASCCCRQYHTDYVAAVSRTDAVFHLFSPLLHLVWPSCLFCFVYCCYVLH